MAQNKYPAFPSRMSLQQFKVRTKGARKGHSLLKRKSDALKARVRACVKEIYDVKIQMNEVIKTAAFSHTRARHAAGDFNQVIISKVESASVKIACKRENVVGVPILKFEKEETSLNQESLIGITQGGKQIRKCKDAHDTALDLLIKLASLQTSFRELDEAMRVTNRRVNALDNVVIPKLENTMMYIASELDEREREDLFRLKKVVAKKKSEQKIIDANKKLVEKQRKEDLKNNDNNNLDDINENDIIIDDMDDDKVDDDDLVYDEM